MQETDSYLVGLDGGGTSCRAAVRSPDGTRTDGAAGPANVTSDFEGAITTIATQIDALLPRAAERTFSAFLGLAGVTGPQMARRVETALAALYPLARIRAAGDQVTMAVGALGPADGGLIGVGTGSFVARQSGGQVTSLGGRGLILGDQGSGGWLGLRLMQEVMLTHDGLRAPTPLATALLAEHDHDPARIIAFARAARPADFATLAPRILAAATQGEPLALGLMQEGAAYLTQGLMALGWQAGERLCLGGGLGAAYQPYLGAALRAAIVPPEGSALDGALALAARLATEAEARA